MCAQVRERLGEASAPKVRAQLAALLQAALRGAAANPSATADDIAVFVYSTLEGGLAAEEAAAAATAAAAEAAGQGQGAAHALRFFFWVYSVIVTHAASASGRLRRPLLHVRLAVWGYQVSY